MGRHLFIAQSNVADNHSEDDFNRWYDEVHIPEMLEIPGVVAAERFLLGPALSLDGMPGGPKSGWKYLAIYDIDSNDIDATLKRIVESLPVLTISEALDMNGMQACTYSSIGGRQSSA